MISFLDKLSKSNVQATDGGTGSLVDMSMDDRSLKTKFAVTDTSAWLPDRRVTLSLTGDEIRCAPTREDFFDPPKLANTKPFAFLRGMNERAFLESMSPVLA